MTKPLKTRRRRASKDTPTKIVMWRSREFAGSELAAKGAAKLNKAYAVYKSAPERDAIYVYLAAVFEFAGGFSSSSDCELVGRRMVKANGGRPVPTQTAFHLLVGATASATDARTRWKWVRCLWRAKRDRVKSQGLQTFIQKQGGVNKCAEGESE